MFWQLIIVTLKLFTKGDHCKVLKMVRKMAPQFSYCNINRFSILIKGDMRKDQLLYLMEIILKQKSASNEIMNVHLEVST